VSWLLLLPACERDEAVLSGVPAPTSVEEVRARREAGEIAASPTHEGAAYQRAEGVYVDVRYLSGRAYNAVRADLEEQLGALAASVDLPEGQGRELRFERATIRVLEGTIYMMDVVLDPPVRRGEALQKLGFPEFVPRDYSVLAREFRVNQVWGFRRLRFLRVEEGSELVERVQAWKRDAADL
jgi:hypothetical protein